VAKNGKTRNKITRLAISDEGFIFDPENGNSFTTNRSGVFILNQLKENAARQEVIDRLVRQFAVSETEAERDLLDFLDLLTKHQLWDNTHG